ncbi:MAG TPA: hypothetical protein VK638_50865 [Edaphobacter sp.]|nr:hypothetical protein [Edaphobacter sp.]
MRIRHSVSALALLLVLSAISGCKRQVTIELSRYHTPVIYVYEGQLLELHPSTGVMTLTFDKGLCKESGPVRGTADHAAVCTIPKQTFNDDKPNIYTLTVSGSDGVSYEVNVKRCTGLCPFKSCTGFCR